MGRKKRTIAVNETATLLSLKLKSKETRHGWCTECEADVVWLELNTAMELFAIARLSEKRMVHLSGEYVCLRSLLNIKNTEI